MKLNFKHNQGVSMIELLIGITLVAMVMTAISLMTTRSIQLAEVSKNRQKAVIIAQEGVEMARDVRNQQPWTTFISGLGTSPLIWRDEQFDTNLFRRQVYRSYDSTNENVLIRSTVSWNDFKGSHTVNQETKLYKY